MKLQGRNLSIRMQGDDVALLQKELVQLGFQITEAELQKAFFYESTYACVQEFQKKHGLEPSGVVDEKIAELINREIELTTARSFVASGQVRREDGRPLQGLQVRAMHEADLGPVRLGKDTTDEEGRYTIRYELLPEVDNINLRVSVSGEDGVLLQSTELIRDARPLEIVNLSVPLTRKPAVQHRIEGRIVLEYGLPARNIKLRLYRHAFGDARTLLGETTTSEKGLYTLTYDVGAKAASLEVRAVDVAGHEVPLSKTMHDLGEDERTQINLVAPTMVQPLEAEFQRLTTDLTPYIGEMTKLADARENAERQDLTLLNRATGWDARLLALACNAAKLSTDAEVGLSQEVLYGLFRVGLPYEKLQLAQVSVEAVDKALMKAKEVGIVGLSDQQMAEAKENFGIFASKTRLALHAPGSRSTYGDLLKAAGLNDDARAKFASVYLNHRGDATQLWERAVEAGIMPNDIQALQLQGKLAFLTHNSEAMTTRLHQDMSISVPVELVGKDLYRAEQWVDEIDLVAGIPADRRDNLTEEDKQRLGALIPVTFIGETVEERRWAYAEDMARKVRLSYPTHVVGRMIEQDTADDFRLGMARPIAATTLKNAATKGFRLGQTPVESFVRDHPDVFDGLDAQVIETAQQSMKILQRVYQITPSNEAMPVLLGLGLTSAYDVVALSQDVFLERYGYKFSSPEQAQLVYRKAQQVSNVTYNLSTIAKQLDSQVPMHGLSASAEVRESVRNELIKQFPTMESLFGSMDFCECEHCRSVLSPAAYLVDLLQFIDAEPEEWGNFLAHWREKHNGQDYTARYKKPYDALIERRPDLPYIPLTCENTNTVLPYIDVVNEILEYYVANDELAEKAAHDTGDATSAELLAEPQNVIAGAYEKLQQARYPLNLPFDLWIETVRSFCNYFETPLWRVLEVFRHSDELFMPAEPYNRTTIFIESLGLSPTEYAIFTDTDPLKKWFELYGFTTAEAATTPTTDADTGQRIDLNSAKALSRRLGVTSKELVEIIETGFVNPKLADLVILHKLGVNIQQVLFYKDHKSFYEHNKDLLGKDRSTLSAADQQRFDSLKKEEWEQLAEVQAFEQRLDDLSTTFQDSRFDAKGWLNTALEDNAFDDILVLTDPEVGCNFDLTTLRYPFRQEESHRAADPMAFLRINVFVRLWRKLGWTIEEIDRALQVFVPKNVPFDADGAHLKRQPLKTALIYLAHLKVLDEQMQVGKQSRLKLITLWSDLVTIGKKSLYAQLFLTRSVLKSDAVFDDALGQYLSPQSLAAAVGSRKHEVQLENVAPADKIDPDLFAGQPRIALSYDELLEVQHLSYIGVLSDIDKASLHSLSPSPALPKLLDAVQVKAREFTLISGHLLALQGALGLTTDEIRRILTNAGKSIDTAELSLVNVSLLYRYGLLAKAIKLSVRELIALKQLSGLDPFMPLHLEPLEDTASKKAIDVDYPFTQTLRFVEIAGHVTESGLKIEDLEYLLQHRFDAVGKYRPNNDATLILMKTLAEGVRAIRTQHPVPEKPGAMGEEALRQKLGLVLSPDVAELLLTMMNGTCEFTATTTGISPADQLKPEALADEPAIRQVSYNDARMLQKLTFRGVLFEAEKHTLMDRLPTTVAPNPHVPSPVLGALLDDIQAQAQTFFDNFLKKQKLRVDDQAGFLDGSDFETLFKPLKPLLKIEPDDTQQLIDEKLKENEKIERENEEELQQRHYRVAKAYLPFVQQRLIRQFIVETITAQMGANAVLVDSLLTDARLLGDPQPLLAAFTATGERGLTASFFASQDGSGPPLATAAFVDADTGLKDKDGNSLKPGGTNSVCFEGYLAVPSPGAYRFYVALDKQNTEAELHFDHLPNSLFLSGVATSDYLELKPGTPYRFTLTLRKLNGGEARLLVQGETLPKDSLAQLTLYLQTAIEHGEHALIVLSKALQLIQSLGLNEREVRYLLTHAADFDNLSLSTLPTRDAQVVLETIAEKKQEADPTLTKEQAMLLARNENRELAAEADQVILLFKQFLRLAGYARLKRTLAGGTDDLISIFETTAVAQVYPLIAKFTRRDEATIKATARALSTTPTFANELAVQRLWEALQVVERFGVSVSSIMQWNRIVSATATPQQRFAIARDLKEAIKARFEPETWHRVAQPIFDKLRQRQRDALVAHVMHQHGFARMEQLYEYFLIDPGMEPVVQTSRIRLAIASVQVFIQRCLLNLEKQVHPSVINAKQWEWIRRYRVWEANRKIFLFPENWLEPEFRDDKTHLFRELEGHLLQGDVSSDLVEDAFLTYLKDLEALARLDIVAMHLEDKADPSLNTLHVIGRTFSQPYKYFYRRFVHQMWTPWEPVAVEIEGDHLAPVVWRDRLYLFWVTFMEKADTKTEGTTPAGEQGEEQKVTDLKPSQLLGVVKGWITYKRVDVQLHWSEYLQGEWSTRESGSLIASLSKDVPLGFDPATVFIHVSKEPYEAGEERGVYIHLGGVINQAFYLAGRNSMPELKDYSPKPENPYSSASTEHTTRYEGSGPLKVEFSQRITTEVGKSRVQSPKETPDILQQQYLHYTLLPCDNTITLGAPDVASLNTSDPEAVSKAIDTGLPEIASLMKPIFYLDNVHTLFIEPSVAERTIEEWQEWVTRTPRPEPSWEHPDWWKNIVVISGIPRQKIPVPIGPGDPGWYSYVGPESLLSVKSTQDWLVNPGTGLLLDGELIASGGRAEMAVLSPAEASIALATGGISVTVRAGSGLAPDETIVVTPGNGRAQDGLTYATGGLNVIGGSGFNSALAQNFDMLHHSNFDAGKAGAGRIEH